jgi:hypothetical protein
MKRAETYKQCCEAVKNYDAPTLAPTPNHCWEQKF